MLRISIAGCLLVQAFFVSSLLFELYGQYGIMQGALRDYFSWGIPHPGYLVHQLSRLGIDERTGLSLLGTLYVTSLVALMVGFHTRLFSILTWLLHVVLSSSHTTSYGFDTFANIFLFYLTFVPSGEELSLDRWMGRTKGEPSWQARLSLRVLQIHLAIAYFTSGIDKAMGEQWWNGEVIWRASMLPIYVQYNLEFLANYPWLNKVFAWGTLLVEIGYPFFIFPKVTRRLWIALVVALHIGIVIFLGLHLFGFVMAFLTLSLFGVSAESASTRALEHSHDGLHVGVSGQNPGNRL